MDVLGAALRGIALATKTVIVFLFPFHAVAWRASAESIRTLLNASDSGKDILTILWRDCMQPQLTTPTSASSGKKNRFIRLQLQSNFKADLMYSYSRAL